MKYSMSSFLLSHSRHSAEVVAFVFRDDCLEEASTCGSKLGHLLCFEKCIKKAGEREKHINFHFREMLIMAFWTGAG